MRELIRIDFLKVCYTLALKLNTRARSGDQLVDCFNHIELFLEEFEKTHIVAISQEERIPVKYVNNDLRLTINRGIV